MQLAVAKHISIVTLLAFIFIPTSLASSVFGMNVQEINNTGKSIWNFIVTAILITGAAITAWLLSSRVQDKWLSQVSGTRYPRRNRLSNALWLIRNPSTWKKMPQGTFLGVLRNSRFGNDEADSEVEIAPNDAIEAKRSV